MSAENKRKLLSKTKEQFYNEIKKYQQKLKPTSEIEGYGSIPIVGEKNYPNLATHSVSNENKSTSFLKSAEIVKKDYNEIFKLKAKNILGSTNENYIKKTEDKITQELRDIYKSRSAIEFTSNFEKELLFDKIVLNKAAGIVGSKNPLLTLNPNENTTTSKQIEKYTIEDIKAKEAIINLYEKGINEHQIINLLALGSFGIQINKKLVPTRWAISAYDKCIEEYLHKKLLKLKLIEKMEVYEHSDKGNHFIIILFPETYRAEIIETFGNNVEADYVDNDNKLKKKEPETAGGFYATKIAIMESLIKRKRQASFISIRVIKDYEIPLGVVFVRESVREAMKEQIFNSSNEREVYELIIRKSAKHYLRFTKSKFISEKKKVKKLIEFF